MTTIKSQQINKGQILWRKKMSKRKKYHALVVDDDKTFIEILALHAKEIENIVLHSVTNFEDMKSELPQLINRIACIILDVRCMITPDQEQEDENFIGTALSLLNQDYPDLPRIIFTGDSGLFSDISRFHNDEIILSKTTEDRDKLFNLIKGLSDNKDKIKLRHSHSDVFDVFDKTDLSNETENDLINLLLHKKNKDYTRIKNNLISIRRIQECIFQNINKKYPEILPDKNLKENKDILFNKIHKHLNGNKSYKTNHRAITTEYYSGVIEQFSNCIYRVSSDNGAHHPYEDPDYKPTVYTVIALTNQLLDLLLWYKALIEKETK